MTATIILIIVSLFIGYITGQSFKKYREEWLKRDMMNHLDHLADAMVKNNRQKTIKMIHKMRARLSQ